MGGKHVFALTQLEVTLYLERPLTTCRSTCSGQDVLAFLHHHENGVSPVGPIMIGKKDSTQL
jgi:hypothetical protein